MASNSLLSKRTGGLLLAGGRSSRFGAEKAAAAFDGRTMMDAVLDRFASLAQCAVSARPDSAAAARARALGLTVLQDAADAPSGPLAGVQAGLAWAAAMRLDVLATAPCDAPHLPPRLFSILLESLGDAPAAFAATAFGEHPLCAVWRVGVHDRVAAAIAGGAHPPVRRLLQELGARRVRFSDTAAFANANTREALAALEHTPCCP